jgi:hypothetical protein
LTVRERGPVSTVAGLCVALAGLTLSACGNSGEQTRLGTTIGLSTSLPLVWGESGDIRGQLAQDTPRHWALEVLEQGGRVVLLDTLAGPKGLALPSDGLLVLVQPRPLLPEENVALDAWVRGGGRLMLFADPMLTAESAYALGDPRRPEAIAMLSPILRHWGLELEFDDTQPSGSRPVTPFGVQVPVDLAGEFRTGRDVPCRLEADGFAADCAIGRGRVLALADAALFDGDDAGRRGSFAALLRLLNR